MSHGFSVEKLTAAHRVQQFSCGQEALDEWLTRYAIQSQAAGSATVFVALCEGTVAGYFALAAGSVDRAGVPARIGRGLGGYPVPVVVLARLAVDRRFQGRGLGSALLKDALLRAANAADSIGVRAVLVHAKEPTAIDFYERFDFEPSPVDQFQLFLLMKDLKAALRPA